MAYRSDEWATVWSRLPRTLSSDPRFAKHLGRLREETSRWSDAADAYRRAWEHAPDNIVGYRLRRALFLAGRTEEAARWDRLVLNYRDAYKRARVIADQVNAALKEARMPEVGLCQSMASLRERMGRVDEARAWQQFDLRK
jgi:hypothetical protein